jgi:hypothetical protein
MRPHLRTDLVDHPPTVHPVPERVPVERADRSGVCVVLAPRADEVDPATVGEVPLQRHRVFQDRGHAGQLGIAVAGQHRRRRVLAREVEHALGVTLVLVPQEWVEVSM